MRHIYANLKLHPDLKGKLLKDAVWKASRATMMTEYNYAMEQLKGKSIKAHDFMANIDPKQWSRAHFSPRAKTDIVSNNHSESFNKVNN